MVPDEHREHSTASLRNSSKSNQMNSRELWRVSDGLNGSGVDGDDGDDDAGQEERGQLVDILDAYKHHHGHQAEADRAIHSHVVQHGTVTSVGVRVEDGRLGD